MPCLLYGMDLGHMKMKATFLYRLKNTKKKEDHIIKVTKYYPGELALIFGFANSTQCKSKALAYSHFTVHFSFPSTWLYALGLDLQNCWATGTSADTYESSILSRYSLTENYSFPTRHKRHRKLRMQNIWIFESFILFHRPGWSYGGDNHVPLPKRNW